MRNADKTRTVDLVLAEKVNYTTAINAAFATCMSQTVSDRDNVISVQELG